MGVITTRFAPSPTGPLHLGHAYAAIVAHDMARAAGGRFLVRMEDIDRARCRPGWEEAALDDLAWLGLTWDGPVLRQSDRAGAYGQALARLEGMGVLFGCHCTRADIRAAASAPQEGGVPWPVEGPDGIIYPGTCRGRPVAGAPAVRLDLTRAVNRVRDLSFIETGGGAAVRHALDPLELLSWVGDVVVARRDMGTSYHLSVVVDDAWQGVTHVTRGEDLFEAAQIHVVLQALLGLPVPVYHHHRLIRDEEGRRLAKRDDARALSLYRAQGATPGDIRRMLGL
jgi:glutamyl-Q tRNA(Asp) synthetase